MPEVTAKQSATQRRRTAMTTDPIPKTLFRLAGPMVIGMISINIFNLVDTIYVGRLGTPELAAMSFTFPVVNLLGSLVIGFGIGVTSVLSHLIGSGDEQRVRSTMRDALIFAVSLVVVIAVLGLLTIDPLFRLIGADEKSLVLIRQYMTIWYIGVPFLVIPMVGNSGIRATGDTKTPAMIMTTAAVVNIVMDPLLIFGLWIFPKMGLAGAALATVIARATTLVFALYVQIHRDKMIEMRWPRVKEMVANWAHVLNIGLPVALTQIIIPISLAVLTRIVAGYGHVAVAAYGAGFRLMMLAMIVPMSLGSAMTPFVGQNFGAKRGDRVREGVRLATRFLVAGGALIYAALAIFARPISSVFTPDPKVVDVMVLFIRLAFIEFMFTGVTVVTGSTFVGMQQPLKSTLLTVMRFVVFMLPLAWLGSHYFGLKGFFLGSGVGASLVGVIAWFWIRAVDLKDTRPAVRAEAITG